MGRSQHKFDAVQLVDFAGAGVIIDGDDIRLLILTAQLFDDALAHDVVWQAAEHRQYC